MEAGVAGTVLFVTAPSGGMMNRSGFELIPIEPDFGGEWRSAVRSYALCFDVCTFVYLI